MRQSSRGRRDGAGRVVNLSGRGSGAGPRARCGVVLPVLSAPWTMAALAGKKGPFRPARRSRVSGCLVFLGSGILSESLAGWGGSNTMVPSGLEGLGTLEVRAQSF